MQLITPMKLDLKTQLQKVIDNCVSTKEFQGSDQRTQQQIRDVQTSIADVKVLIQQLEFKISKELENYLWRTTFDTRFDQIQTSFEHKLEQKTDLAEFRELLETSKSFAGLREVQEFQRDF